MELIVRAYSAILGSLVRVPRIQNRFRLTHLHERLHGVLPTGVVVWIHAASVGEVRGIAPLITALVQRNGAESIGVTTTSYTGLEQVRTMFPHVFSSLVPLDTISRVSEFLGGSEKRDTPKILIINETELWPALIFVAARKGVRVVIVNGRISDHTETFYTRCSFVLGPILRKLDRIFVQTDLDKQRFISAGAVEQNIQVAGSTKYEREELEPKPFFSSIPQSNRRVVVFGSVREDEENVIVETIVKLLQRRDDLLVIIAPRHPSRFDACYALLAQGVSGITRSPEPSLYRRNALDSLERIPTPGILLLDTLGELKDAYAVCDIAFVGGTLGTVGGHNILEPCQFGVPVVIGPSTENVREAFQVLKARNAVFVASDANGLAVHIVHLLEDAKALAQSGKAAQEAAQAMSGAKDVVLEYLDATS